jgi:hypothetical protein
MPNNGNVVYLTSLHLGWGTIGPKSADTTMGRGTVQPDRKREIEIGLMPMLASAVAQAGYHVRDLPSPPMTAETSAAGTFRIALVALIIGAGALVLARIAHGA